MKIKSLLLALASVMAIAGCHAQQPVTTYAIDYSATAPASCTATAPCSIEYSVAVEVSGACPASLPTIACTSTAGSTTCAQSNAPTGTTVCVVAQTVQNGVTSVATTPIQVVVPALPGQPTNVQGALAPSAVAEVQHDNLEQLALADDGSLKALKSRTIHLRAQFN
jgi:hypothetical protein